MSNLWHVTEICALSAQSSQMCLVTPSYPQYMGMLLPIVPGCSKTHWETYKSTSVLGGRQGACRHAGILLVTPRFCSPWALGGVSVTYQNKPWIQVLAGYHPSKGWACCTELEPTRVLGPQIPILVHSSGTYCPLLNTHRTGFKHPSNLFPLSVLHLRYLQIGSRGAGTEPPIIPGLKLGKCKFLGSRSGDSNT